MFVYLFDRKFDRLGANITTYIAQILFCHKNKYIIKFINNSKQNYRYCNSIFVQTLFNYIDRFNEELYKINITDNEEFIITTKHKHDWITTTSFSLNNIQVDFITYFHNYIYNDIISDFIKLSYNYNIPFDPSKTILVHLRLDDRSHSYDYNGYECSEYYKNKILHNEDCHLEFNDRINNQAPLSKNKLENIINKAKNEFPGYRVILLTSPGSDTSFLDCYEVIKNHDVDLDLYLLTMCNVAILSRSTYALSSLFFNNNKQKIYVPLWGHFVCTGLNTIYDKINTSKIEYFY